MLREKDGTNANNIKARRKREEWHPALPKGLIHEASKPAGVSLCCLLHNHTQRHKHMNMIW